MSFSSVKHTAIQAAPRERAAGRGKYERGRSAEERKNEQRRRLREAAAHVFAAKGYAGATVEDIVSRAGMSRRTFYEHFADLHAALLDLHDHASSVTYQFVEERVRAQTDPIERLRTGITSFLSLLGAHGDLARIVFREVRAAGPEHAALREAVLARFTALILEGVKDAYEKGVTKRPPDELTIFALVAALEAVGMRYVERREEQRAIEAAPALVELVVRALL
jgi:AcrR family transcriptional regulator